MKIDARTTASGGREHTMAPSIGSPKRGYVPLRHRRESYEVEIAALPETYRAARDGKAEILANILSSVSHLPTWYVGNGGTMAIAEHAAFLHNQRTGLPAMATTSLGFINGRATTGSAAIIISAGAKHPDTAAAVDTALKRGMARVILVTEREQSELLRPFDDARVEVFTATRPGPRDGFLATNSVLNLATVFAVASGPRDRFPATLPSFRKPTRAVTRPGDDLLVLAAAGAWAAATDLETRLVETGLAGVQKTDYRNFAHGRHLGLSRTADRVSVIAFSDADTYELAAATLKLLPSGIPVQHVSTLLRGPLASLDLLVSSMQLTSDIGIRSNIDVARPEVPSFGRRLYRLDSRRHLPNPQTAKQVLRKLESARLPQTSDLAGSYSRALSKWLGMAANSPIASLVLDYDGTVCTTPGRFELPQPNVQDAILRVVSEGVVLGIASGRGGSLVNDLRAWIPDELQSHVFVGLYNGAVRGRLDEDRAFERQPDGPMNHGPVMRRTVRAISSVARRFGLEAEVRSHQVSISGGKSGLSEAVSAGLMEVIASHNAGGEVQLKAVRSAHSIDVIPAQTSKTMLQRDITLRSTLPGVTLAIGDQGQLGGNDFELLAANKLTLSVDRVSGDPARCWNLSADDSGPDLLVRYLKSVRRSRSRVHTFRWSV